MRCEGQLMQFNRVARATMDAIKTTHQNADRLKILWQHQPLAQWN